MNLTEKELAARWRVSTRHVRQLREEGRLDHMRFGRRVVYPLAFIEQYEREQTVLAQTVTMRTARTR